MSFADRIIEACFLKTSRLVVGLDPHWHLIPASVKAEHNGDPQAVMTAFLKRVVEVTADLAVAYKPQIAFYERFGLAGLAALRQVLEHIYAHDGIVLMDENAMISAPRPRPMQMPFSISKTIRRVSPATPSP